MRPGRNIRIGPKWSDDITLLDLPEEVPGILVAVSGLPRPALTLLEGEQMQVGSRKYVKGDRVPLLPEGNILTIGGSQIRIVPLNAADILREKGVGMRRGLVSKTLAHPKRWVWSLAALSVCALMATVVTWDTGSLPNTRSAKAPAGLQGAMEKSVGDILYRAGLEDIAPAEGYVLDMDPLTGFAILKGFATGESNGASGDAFVRWYDRQRDLPPMLVRTDAPPAPVRTDYPDIGMVLSGQGGGMPIVISSTGEEIMVGEKFASGWIYEAYRSGQLVFQRDGDTVRVDPKL